MHTIQHWIAGSETAGAARRYGPVYNRSLSLSDREHRPAGCAERSCAAWSGGRPEGVRFYTRAKAITSRWPGTRRREHHRDHMQFPTAV
jgi:hypothetical protein